MTVNDDSDCAETNNRNADNMDMDSHHSSVQQPDVVKRQNSGQRVKFLSSDSRISNKFSDGRVGSDPHSKQKRSSSREEEEVKVVDEGYTGTLADNKTLKNSGFSRRSVKESRSQWMEEKTRELKECYITQEYDEEEEDCEDPHKMLNRDGYDLRSNYRRLSAINHNVNHPVSLNATSIPQHHPIDSRKDIPQSHPIDMRRGYPQPHLSDNNGFRKVNQQSDSQESSNVVKENGHRFAQHTSSSNLAVAIPSTSNTVGSSNTRTSTDSTKIIPRLNQSGGFFQIGPVGEPDEEMFHFSVTIVYAKNLDEVCCGLLLF